MATVPEITSTVQFDTALRQAAAKARTRYAGEAVRLDKGLTIALNHGVTFLPDGTALVQSQREAEIIYEVKDGRCDCPDAERAPEFRCKHRWAACLTRKATKAVAAAQPARFYATYYPPSGEMVPGIATLTATGWLFIGDAGEEPQYVSTQALCLGGNCAIADAQQVQDGNRVAAICGY